MAGAVVDRVVVVVGIVIQEGDLLAVIIAVSKRDDLAAHLSLGVSRGLQHAVIDAERLVVGSDAGIEDGDDLAGAVGADRHIEQICADHDGSGIRLRLQLGLTEHARDVSILHAGERFDRVEIGIVHRDGHAVEQIGVFKVDFEGHVLLLHLGLDGIVLAQQLCLGVGQLLEHAVVFSKRTAFGQDDDANLIARLIQTARRSELGHRQLAELTVCAVCRKGGGAEREYQHEGQYHRQPSCLLHGFTPLLTS